MKKQHLWFPELKVKVLSFRPVEDLPMATLSKTRDEMTGCWWFVLLGYPGQEVLG